MKKSLTIRKEVEKSAALSYIEIPFEMPGNVEMAEFSYTYQNRVDNCIDFALYRGSELIGASGSNRDKLWISEYDSSDGFKRMLITPGEYKIILGAYKIADCGVSVTYNIDFYMKELTLLKGDLHTHTTASDGAHTFQELAHNAKIMGLDFIFVTNHNTYDLNMVSNKKLTLIPGVEWTHYKGHASFLGILDALKLPYYTNDAKEMMLRAHKAGALISLNHPFDNDCGWHFGFDVYHDMIEVWNGMPNAGNFAAVKYWHERLCAGERLVAVCGSDFHKYSAVSSLAAPTAYVYSESRGASGILEAIKKGRLFLSLFHNGPTASISCGDKIMGDMADFDQNKVIEFSFDGVKKGDLISIINNKGIVKSVKIDSEKSIHMGMPMENQLFYRAELARELINGVPALPILLTNPLYIGK